MRIIQKANNIGDQWSPKWEKEHIYQQCPRQPFGMKKKMLELLFLFIFISYFQNVYFCMFYNLCDKTIQWHM